MSAVARAIVFCTQVDPDFTRELQGSLEADIAALDAQHPVDPDHAAFLRSMGNVTPELGLGPMAFSANELREAYSMTKGTLPDDISLLGVARDDPWLDAVLMRRTDEQSTIALVPSCVGRDFGELDPSQAEPIAGGIADLLCRATMQLLRGGSKWPFVRIGSERHVTVESMPRLLALLEDRQFTEKWPSNHITKWLARGPLRVVARQAPGQALQVTIFSSDPGEQEDLMVAIAAPVALAFAPVEAASLREAYRRRALDVLAAEETAVKSSEQEAKRLGEGLRLMTLARTVDPQAPLPAHPIRGVNDEQKKRMIVATRLFLSGSSEPASPALRALQSHLVAPQEAKQVQWTTLLQAAREADAVDPKPRLR